MNNIEAVADGIFSSMLRDEEFVKNRTLVVVGGNTTGKTTFIKALLSKAKEQHYKQNWVYYIDPMNRTLKTNNNSTNEVFEDYTPYDILAYRTRSKNYTNNDVFAAPRIEVETATDGGELSYNELCTNLDEYNPIFRKFVHIELSKSGSAHNQLVQDNFYLIVNRNPQYKLDSLSSSEVAMMRMLMEITYAQKCACKYVVIDEFDAFLEIRNMVEFLKGLIQEYASLRFIVVIHNVEALIEMEDVDVLLISKSEVQEGQSWMDLFDGNEVNKLAQLNRLMHRYSSRTPSEAESKLKSIVTDFVNKGTISKRDRDSLRMVEPQNLSVRERVLYDYLINTLIRL